MAQTLVHRGPDSDGYWKDKVAGLSHKRLAIIDLSTHGAQPMISASGRYVLTYNGEIYNYLNLRQELEKDQDYTWRGRSDTEVLLAAIETWGLPETLDKINGMFAFGLWDRITRTLTLARDRLGEKPLYIGWIGKQIAFASELKAFQCIRQWEKNIDCQAVGYFLRYGFIPAPLSIYQGVYKLPAGHFISFTAEDTIQRPIDTASFKKLCNCYWNLSTVAWQGINNQLAPNAETAIDILDELLSNSIQKRMLADVPVGALLSGGIDSSLVTAIMQKHSARPVQTFTIGFNEDSFNEAEFAKKIAEYLRSEHTEIILSPDEALSIIPELAQIYCEPFADSSQIPSTLIAKITQQKVTVALSGDGGDELFSGYCRYKNALKFWPLLRLLPSGLRNLPDHLIESSKHFSRFISPLSTNDIIFRMWRFSKRISANNFQDYYGNLLSLSLTRTISKDYWPTGLPMCNSDRVPNGLDIEQQMMFIDQMSYLPDDILVKTDRASMASSLELRIPLLDHTIVEFAWRIPSELRRQQNKGKFLLHAPVQVYSQRAGRQAQKGF